MFISISFLKDYGLKITAVQNRYCIHYRYAISAFDLFTFIFRLSEYILCKRAKERYQSI